MSGHPGDSVLRRYLDEPVAVSAADRSHLSACARCGAVLASMDEDRTAGARALDLLDEPASDGEPASEPTRIDRAWATLTERFTEPVPVSSGVGDRPRTARRMLRRHPVAAAVAASLVLVSGTAAAAAADWLPIFRTEKVAAVKLSTSDMTALSDVQQLAELSAYGKVSMPSGDPLTPVADAAAPAARSGLTVPTVAKLPKGVQGTPSYTVLDRQTVEFTFSTATAARTAAQRGTTLPPVPAGLDGSRLRVQVGPGVVQNWGEQAGIPALFVARVKAPTAESQGASLPVIRDYLLSLPGIPASLATQLRAVTTDGTTLPLPIPTDVATSSSARVGSAEATVVQTKDRSAAAVIWVDHGILQAVAGPLSRDDVLEVARALH